METIKKGSKSIDVLSLQCCLPGLVLDGNFGGHTEEVVKKFQRDHGLKDDGVVGSKTWSLLLPTRPSISEADYKGIASELGVSPAILKAIHKVEASGKSYLPEGYPSLLFEAHIFYSRLGSKKAETLLPGNRDILSKTWNKSLYKGGVKEVTRLNKAFLISPEAALASASFGAFQICGFNWKKSGVSSAWEFYREMWTSEVGQFRLLSGFLKGSGIVPYMKSLNFKEIARRYNGEGYKKNGYDTKLRSAYQSFL